MLFLKAGFAPANMDEIARRAGVSKQTIYAHFGTKDDLFTQVVMDVSTAMTTTGLDVAQSDLDDLAVRDLLADYGERQLAVMLDWRVLQLHRLVVAEAARFPELAAQVHDAGLQQAISGLSRKLAQLTRLGVVETDNPRAAAIDFCWLLLGEPINRALLLGEDAIPSPRSIRMHAEHVAAVFMRAYGRKSRR